jgi:phosphatidylethanolamine-binding protein (PEBP) family uncharacterized protein
MRLSSTAFADGERVPPRHTCDGANVAPDLAWSDLPGATESLAI